MLFISRDGALTVSDSRSLTVAIQIDSTSFATRLSKQPFTLSALIFVKKS
jgi:hypothetical protein